MPEVKKKAVRYRPHRELHEHEINARKWVKAGCPKLVWDAKEFGTYVKRKNYGEPISSS